MKAKTITIPQDIAVFEDAKTKVKTVAFPFVFANGKNGILSITKLDKFPWFPIQDIETITINFK